MTDTTHTEISRTLTKLIGGGQRLTATAAFHGVADGEPYFSVTAELRKYGHQQEWGRMDMVVAQHFPVLAPVIKVHLADGNGWPMHAAANADYWAKQGKVEILARHLRVSEAKAEDIMDRINNRGEDAADICEELAPRWAEEAAAAFEVLDGLARLCEERSL